MRVRRVLCGVILGAVVGVFAPATAAAADGEESSERSYSSVVVQNRKFDPTHEFTVTGGVLPLDAFAKGITASGSYTLHFTRHTAWEVVQFSYSFPVQTDLNDKLASFDIQPTPFELLEYYLSSNVVFKPVYWKGSWMNSSLIHGEFLFTLGGAYGWFTNSQQPGASIGTGFRLWGSEVLSFRLDTRYLAFASGLGGGEFEISDEIWVGLGTSLSF